jgi:hypothetical protein
MRKLFLTVAAGVLGLALTGTAEARPGHEHFRPTRERAYHGEHGVRFKGGYYYAGREHHHWTRTVWDAPHHRYIYWDPYVQCYYYWYQPGNCYYPVSYCP